LSTYGNDPAYEHEMGVLEDLCRRYIKAREAKDFTTCLLLCGAMTAQHAIIYNLSPPAGFMNPGDAFRRHEQPLLPVDAPEPPLSTYGKETR
jgi:hypothetical protein